MKRILSIILLALAVMTSANAQEFLDNLRNRQDGKGKVTVSQSKDIDDLLKAPAKQQPQQTQSVQQPQQIQQPKQTTTTQQHKIAVQTNQQPVTQTQQKPAAQNKKNQRVTSSSTTDIYDYTTPSVDTRKKVMRKSYRMPGYRIQVFSGGNSRQDKQKAFNAGKVIKQNFPDQPVYAHFKSPSWKCRMGNFKSQYEAEKLLSQVKKLGFPQATVVKDNIQVQY